MCQPNCLITIRIENSLGGNMYHATYSGERPNSPPFNVRSPFDITIINANNYGNIVNRVFNVRILSCNPLLCEILDEQRGEVEIIL